MWRIDVFQQWPDPPSVSAVPCCRITAPEQVTAIIQTITYQNTLDLSVPWWPIHTKKVCVCTTDCASLPSQARAPRGRNAQASLTSTRPQSTATALTQLHSLSSGISPRFRRTVGVFHIGFNAYNPTA